MTDAHLDWGRCTFCSEPTYELVFLLNGVHPDSAHVCLHHSGMLRWLGAVSENEPEMVPARGRHWLDDPDLMVAEPPWRELEYGLAGLGHPTKRRRMLLDAARGELTRGESGDDASLPGSPRLEPAQASVDRLAGDAGGPAELGEGGTLPPAGEEGGVEPSLSLF